MVDVQVRTHHVVDVVHRQFRRCEAPLESIAAHHVPEWPRRPRFMVADTGIDENVVTRRLDNEALYAQHEAAGDGVDECRLEPGAILF
jgi:hypothetical protein